MYTEPMTDREIDKLIAGPYRYGNVLPSGEVVTIGTQLELRRRLQLQVPSPAPYDPLLTP